MKLLTLPNIITLGNLFCGSIACILAIKGIFPELIFFFIFMSLLLDFLDGFSARLTNQSSPIGGELDSLADVISFGLLPGFLMFQLLNGDILFSLCINYFKGIYYDEIIEFSYSPYIFLALLGLLIPLFSALRLAKFNLDVEQKNYFKGLNTPTNTLLILSLYFLYYVKNVVIIQNPIFLILIIFISCYLLISDIPMMSLKFKGKKWENNKLIFSFLAISFIIFFIFGLFSIPFLILLYILVSIIFKKEIIK